MPDHHPLDRESAIRIAQDLVRSYRIQPNVLFPDWPPLESQKSAEVRVLYRDPATGVTLSGKGRPPRWIKGLDRDKLLEAVF